MQNNYGSSGNEHQQQERGQELSGQRQHTAGEEASQASQATNGV